jgi:hypothetical protein
VFQQLLRAGGEPLQFMRYETLEHDKPGNSGDPISVASSPPCQVVSDIATQPAAAWMRLMVV